MKQLLFALLFIPALLFAQEDQHYLAGPFRLQTVKSFLPERLMPLFKQGTNLPTTIKMGTRKF